MKPTRPHKPFRPLWLLVLAGLALAGLIVAAGLGGQAAVEAFFVRSGLAVTAPALSRLKLSGPTGPILDWRPGEANRAVLELGRDRFLVPFPWRLGKNYHLDLESAQGRLLRTLAGPLKPSPLRLALIPLEDVPPGGRDQMSSNNTSVRFSPDGRRLAIGSQRGYLRVVEVPSGRKLLERRLAEGLVKDLAWGQTARGLTLFVGEQSPDGFVYGLHPDSGETLWRFRLADDLETSPIPRSEDRMGHYSLPGAYQLKALPNGDLVVAGTHAWYKGDRYIYRAALYRLDGDTGRVKWRWPEDRPLPYGLTWLGASAGGTTLAVLTGTWLEPASHHPKYRNGTLYCLNGADGTVRWAYSVPVLAPHFARAGSWRGISVSPDGSHVALGLYDGRAFLFPGRPAAGQVEPLWVKDLGTPILVGGLAVAAAVSYAALSDEAVYFSLPGTAVPPGSPQDQASRPLPHPQANQMVAFDFSGQTLWRWQSRGSPQGAFLSADGRFVATAVAHNFGFERPDEFGLALFDAARPGPAGERLVYLYPTEGPVHFSADLSADGKYLALTETPYTPDQGRTIHGRYQVHLIH